MRVTNGEDGFKEFADTDHHDIKASCLEMLEDTVFAALQGNGQIIGRNISTGVVTGGRTYPMGHKIYGLFTGLDLASGAVRAYA